MLSEFTAPGVLILEAWLSPPRRVNSHLSSRIWMMEDGHGWKGHAQTVLINSWGLTSQKRVKFRA